MENSDEEPSGVKDHDAIEEIDKDDEIECRVGACLTQQVSAAFLVFLGRRQISQAHAARRKKDVGMHTQYRNVEYQSPAGVHSSNAEVHRNLHSQTLSGIGGRNIAGEGFSSSAITPKASQ